MARIPYPDLSQVSSAVRRTLEALPNQLNIFRMLMHLDECYTPLLQLGSAILAKQRLSPYLRELAILRVAHASKSTYEWTQHVPIAIATGASEDQVAALERGDGRATCFTADEQALLAFTDEVIHHTRPGDAALAAVARILSHQEILELTLSIGFYMLVARLMETTGVESEPSGGDETIRMFKDKGLA